MPGLFTAIKFIHILSAIIAFGFNATYAIWLIRAQRNPKHSDFALRGVKFMDDYFAHPTYILLLLSGLSMVFIARYQLTTLWIAGGIVLWMIALILGYGVYTPTLSGQIRTLGAKGADSVEFRALSARGTVVGIALAALVTLILALMVFKPTF